MFKASLDNKAKVTDPNGNEIVDLTSATFRNNEQISQYFLRKVPSEFRMRPDLVALTELGTTDKTEYIMMFNQIGNPFSIDKDDVLLIPELIEADSMIYDGVDSPTMDEDIDIQEVLVKNYYKHSNRNNTVDMSSYDEFLNTPIPSGRPSRSTTPYTPQTESVEPYMLRDNEEAVVIRNGRIYFNDPNDVGLQDVTGNENAPQGGIGSGGWNGMGPTASPGTPGGGHPWPITIQEIDSNNVDAQITSVINGVQTDLSEANCVYNGTNLADFMKAFNVQQR